MDPGDLGVIWSDSLQNDAIHLYNTSNFAFKFTINLYITQVKFDKQTAKQ